MRLNKKLKAGVFNKGEWVEELDASKQWFYVQYIFFFKRNKMMCRSCEKALKSDRWETRNPTVRKLM